MKTLMSTTKNILPLRKNKFLLTIGTSPVGKAGFSSTHGNKIISNRNFALMGHIFDQSENKKIK